jgi:hypothetical protein
VLANATPQKIDAPVSGWTPFLVIIAGVVMIALTLVPTLLRRRTTPKLPTWLQGPGR